MNAHARVRERERECVCVCMYMYVSKFIVCVTFFRKTPGFLSMDFITHIHMFIMWIKKGFGFMLETHGSKQ